MIDCRKDFPIFSAKPNWVYLDTAATALKPYCLAERLKQFYDKEYATVNRGVYKDSLLATEYFQRTREEVAQLFSSLPEEIIFTKGTTESINLLAHSLEEVFQDGDSILLSEAEHHSNIVPWQLLAKRKNLQIKVFTITSNGEWDLNSFKKQLTKEVKLVAVQHVSNVLGTIFPVKEISKLAKANGSLVVIDGAQAPFHTDVNVRELDVDFYVCSAHKMYGPTGLGFLYGKKSLLENMPPFLGGGDMIESVSFEKTTFQAPPLRFEAGTPNIADVIAFSSVLGYLKQFKLDSIIEHERALTAFLNEGLKQLSGIKRIGTSEHKVGITSFCMEQVHPLDLALFLDTKNIAVRSGHLCAQPLLRKFNSPQVVRVSFGMYTNQKDLELFLEALEKAKKIF